VVALKNFSVEKVAQKISNKIAQEVGKKSPNLVTLALKTQ
jgi:hypothetical protein